MSIKKISKLSVGALKALEMLQSGTCKTAADMKIQGFAVNSAHLTVLVSRGYATSADSVIECEYCGSKRKVKEYTLTDKGIDFEAE
jgi:DNA-directed RNA polymerase subunit RPC12/RpoP